jgi:hypothetical protein
VCKIRYCEFLLSILEEHSTMLLYETTTCNSLKSGML